MSLELLYISAIWGSAPNLPAATEPPPAALTTRPEADRIQCSESVQ